jgi:hypothetical protein
MKIIFKTHEGILDCADFNLNDSGESVLFCEGLKFHFVENELSLTGEKFSLNIKPSTPENRPGEQEKISEVPFIDRIQTSIPEDNYLGSEPPLRRPDPTEENIEKIIRANGFRYDYMELENIFFGRILDSKLEKGLYSQLTDTVRNVAAKIAEEEKGVWHAEGSRKIDDGRYTKVNVLRKSDE